MQIIPPEKGYPEFARFRTPAMRWLLVIAMWLGAASFSIALVWLLYLSQTSPAYPDPATGQVAELNNHGRFYVRQATALAFNISCWGGWMLFASGGIAWLAIFGQDQGRPSALDRVGKLVLICGFVLMGAVLLTNGRFPFAMLPRS